MIINTIQGGKAPVIQSKSVKSTTSQQTVTAPSGVDGYNPITVEPIKLQEKYVVPDTDTSYYKDVVPDSGYDGLSKVWVSPVTLQEKTASPSQSVQTVTPDTSGGYKGLSKVTVNAATLQSKTATLSTVGSQTIRPDSSYYGLSSVTVPMVNLQSKTVTPSDSQQIITADSTYDGLKQVTVEAAPASGTKVGTWSVTPSTTTRIRLTDAQGITDPYFAIIQFTAPNLNLSNVLQIASWARNNELLYIQKYYLSNNGQTIFQADGGLNVSMDGGNILIEITDDYGVFNMSHSYTVIIGEQI